MQTENRRADDEREMQADELSLTQHVRFLTDELSEREREIENLQHALRNSRTIGIALGILMAGWRTTRSETFAALCSESKRLNRKLIEIAEHVEQTGGLP